MAFPNLLKKSSLFINYQQMGLSYSISS